MSKPLTDLGRRELRSIGIAYTLELRRCTKCNKHSSEIPADKVHPMRIRIEEARRALENDRENVRLRQHIHRLISQQYHLSRCCAARYKKFREDQMQPLWEMWQERHARVAARGADVEMLRWDMCREDDGWVDDERLAEHKKEFHDDFVILNFLTGWGDAMIRRFIRVMRAEEERQRHVAENPQSPAPETVHTQTAYPAQQQATRNPVSLPIQTTPLR